MGFSFSKSVKFGPLRVNASTRGVGLSAGVRGARVSIGPRGTYVSLGTSGFRYRAKVGGSRKHQQHRKSQMRPSPAPTRVASSHEPGQIHTASVAELVDASPDAVLRDIQERVHRFDWFKAYAISIGASTTLVLGSPSVALALLLVSVVPGFYLYIWNRDRRTARLIYDVDDQELLYRLSVCNAAGESLSKMARLWHINASLATTDWKRNAGASSLIRRTETACRPGSLRRIELNIEPWSVAVGPQEILFLPDRIIVHENERFAALPYEELVAQYETIRFIEEDVTPPDARQVDTTWRFVNKSGGPDRRFNNNRELPVMEYGRLTLRSPHGLTIILDSSNPMAALRAQQALQHLRGLARASGSSPSRPRWESAAPTAAAAVPSATPTAPSATPAVSSHVRDLVVVLKYIAAADRRLSSEELDFVAKVISSLVAEPRETETIMAGFQTMRSDAAETQRALSSLTRSAPTVASKIPVLLEALAGADGRVTPKERERLGQVMSWLNLDGEKGAVSPYQGPGVA